DRAGLPFHQALVLHRLREVDVAAVRELDLRIAARIDHRIFRELKEVAAEEAETVLDGGGDDAQRGHHADDREDADRDAKHGQERAQLVRAQRDEGDAGGLTHTIASIRWSADVSSAVRGRLARARNGRRPGRPATAGG